MGNNSPGTREREEAGGVIGTKIDRVGPKNNRETTHVLLPAVSENAKKGIDSTRKIRLAPDSVLLKINAYLVRQHFNQTKGGDWEG